MDQSSQGMENAVSFPGNASTERHVKQFHAQEKKPLKRLKQPTLQFNAKLKESQIIDNAQLNCASECSRIVSSDQSCQGMEYAASAELSLSSELNDVPHITTSNSNHVILIEQPTFTVFQINEEQDEESAIVVSTPDQSRQGIDLAASETTQKSKNNKLPTFEHHKPSVSKIWDYLKKDITNNTHSCLICGKKNFKGTNATNAKKHLKSCDNLLWKRVVEQDASVNKLEPPKSQLKLSDAFIKKYDQNHSRQLSFRQSLALFVGANSVSNILPQRKEFKRMIEVIDPKLTIPSRPTIHSDIQKMYEDYKLILRNSLKNVRRITLCSDIWTKKGYTSSYIGVTASFYHPVLKKKVQAVLGVQPFETVTHTSNDVIREMRKIILEYELKPSQIWRAMTDGGSNMVCSHKNINKFFEKSEILHQTLDLASEHYSDSDSENEVFENEQDLDETEATTEDENSAFQHLTCFVHTLINCLKLIETDPILKEVIEPVKLLVAKFNKSSKLTEEMFKKTNVKLVSFIDTRWNYIYHVLVRIKRVKEELIEILLNHCKTKYMLSDTQWYQIETLINFLEPFNKHTNMSARERNIVSSEVIVTIITIYGHLDDYDTDPFLANLALKIKNKMKIKFSHWFHKKNNKFDGTYLVATMLDPRYRAILPEEQLQYAKKFLLDDQRYNCELRRKQNEEILPTNAALENVNKKCRFPIMQTIKNKIQQESRQETNSRGLVLVTELEKYLQDKSLDHIDDHENIFEFWETRSLEYPVLSTTALEFLSIPDSTADVERIFSYGGILAHGRRNKLTGKNLEREIILCKNQEIINELKSKSGREW